MTDKKPDMPDMPDMGEMFEQMEDAMSALPDIMGQMQNIMSELPGQMEDMQRLLDELPEVTENLPGQMQNLGAAMADMGDLADSHGANVDDLVGDSNWTVQADIRVGNVLHVMVDAAQTLQLSPQANIPLSMHEAGVSFEFAPMLTIRNSWERADIPTFAPMGDDIVVPITQFGTGEPFSMHFSPAGQEHQMSIDLSFERLE